MQLLPEGLVLPPLPYAVALAVGVVAVLVALFRLRPLVTEHVVLAGAPWMALGGAAHGLEQYGLVPDPLVPLVTAPAVYLTTAVLAGGVWALAAASTDESGAPTRVLAQVGTGLLVLLVAGTYAYAYTRVSLVTLSWPIVIVAGALALAGPIYYLLWQYRPTTAKQVGVGGAIVLFAHALDGVSTAVGVDLLGTGERSPVPRMIMDFAAGLPTEPFLGMGWLFLVVKLVVATAIVVLLADYVEEEPAEGNLLVLVVAAVGMGPAANNLTLFLLTGGA